MSGVEIAPSAAYPASGLELEMIDPGSVALVRLYQYDGTDWEEPALKYRNARVDPPDGNKGAFAVLYMADSLQAAAAECRILVEDPYNECSWDSAKAGNYKIVRYTHDKPAIFIKLDGHPNASNLGLTKLGRINVYPAYQEAALNLYRRFSDVVHGLSWQSFMRNQPGRVYALWHQHKTTIGLTRHAKPPHGHLSDALEWKDFLAANPEIKSVAPGL
jgi:hypothetical protein